MSNSYSPASARLVSALIGIALLVVGRQLIVRLVPFDNDQVFFCDDDELRLPHRRDTVSANLLFSIIALTLVIVLSITELSMFMTEKTSLRQLRRFSIASIIVHPLIYHVSFLALMFISGILSNSSITNLAKRTASRLRPDFFAVCRPNVSLTCLQGSNEMISSISCLGVDDPDSHFSLPSGHSSHIFFMSFFLILYVQQRWRWPVLFRSVLQLVLVQMAVFVALSRIRDNKHRYTDVLSGALIGCGVAWFMVHMVLENFSDCGYMMEGEEDQALLLPSHYIKEEAMVMCKSTIRPSHSHSQPSIFYYGTSDRDEGIQSAIDYSSSNSTSS